MTRPKILLILAVVLLLGWRAWHVHHRSQAPAATISVATASDGLPSAAPLPLRLLAARPHSEIDRPLRLARANAATSAMPGPRAGRIAAHRRIMVLLYLAGLIGAGAFAFAPGHRPLADPLDWEISAPDR